MRIAVKDLRPNPFRHLERYPINRDKVDALKQSIKDTKFWDNLLGRKSPTERGTIEQAFGHHRYVALKELGIKEIDMSIRDLDDTQMAKIMAHENMVEWSANTMVEQETVRSIVQAFAEGKIELPRVKKGSTGAVRTAPSFQPGDNGGVLYNATSIADFVSGWNAARTEATLNALAVIELGLLSDHDLDGLTTYQADQVARQVRRVEKESGGNTALAKKVGKELAGGMRTATGRTAGRGSPPTGHRQAITYHGARKVADQALARERRDTAPKEYPSAGKAIPELALKFDDVPTEALILKVEQVIEVRRELNPKDVRMLVTALRGVAKRVSRLADRLEA